MARRTLVPTAGALTVGLVASLVLAAPAAVAADEFAGAAHQMPARQLPAPPQRDARRATARTAGPRRVVTRDQVTRGGCQYFLRHATVDMQELAVRLSISRATLYRVVHSRDCLLADVLWRLARTTLRRVRSERTQYGVEGVLEVGRRFTATLLDSKPFRAFLTSEPDAAARVLLTATGGVHHHAVGAQKEILLEANPPDQVWLAGDLDGLAYLLVRIYESTFYADLLANRPPDQELAERAIRALLLAWPTGRQ